MRIGSSVKCIKYFDAEDDIIIPEINIIYKVRDIVPLPLGKGLLLEEIINKAKKYSEGFLEKVFDIKGFVEVDTLITNKNIIQKKEEYNEVQC